MKDEPIFKSVKEYAFNNGLDVELILLLGGLLLKRQSLRRTASNSYA